MGYSIGYDSANQRDVGYGVPATCEHPGCDEEIDRGMGYACGGGMPEDGCGRYFCGAHGGGVECSQCVRGKSPFPLKPDRPEWIQHKLTCPSWAEWRAKNPQRVAAQQQELGQ